MGHHRVVVHDDHDVDVGRVLDDHRTGACALRHQATGEHLPGRGAGDERCRQRGPQHRSRHEMRPELLEELCRLDHAEPAPTGVLGDHEPEHAERGHVGPHRPVDGRVLAGCDRVEPEVVGAEARDRLLQLELTGVEAELHQRPFVASTAAAATSWPQR